MSSENNISTRRFYAIPAEMIKRKEGFNPRFDFGDLEALMKSIMTNGVLQPLRVRKIPTGYELVDGDRRFTAIERLIQQGSLNPEEFKVPVLLESAKLTDLQALINMFEANTGKPFLPLEEASAFKRMKDAGMSLKEICRSVGRSDSHVIDTLKLLEAPEDVKTALAEKRITKAGALAAVKNAQQLPTPVTPVEKKRTLEDMMQSLETVLEKEYAAPLAENIKWFNNDVRCLRDFLEADSEFADEQDVAFWMGVVAMYRQLRPKK